MPGVVFVGELNPYGSDPKFALHDLPRGSAGGRLRALLGMRRTTYLSLHRVNLCSGVWEWASARRRAEEISRQFPDAGVVMLGRKVTRAFGLELEPFRREGRFVSVPHPSGRNRAWNTPGARSMALSAILEVAPEIRELLDRDDGAGDGEEEEETSSAETRPSPDPEPQEPKIAPGTAVSPERLANYLARRWMHEPPSTGEQREVLLETISSQCGLAAQGQPPSCGICLYETTWIHLYRCFQCGLWLCPACARKHFPEVTR